MENTKKKGKHICRRDCITKKEFQQLKDGTMKPNKMMEFMRKVKTCWMCEWRFELFKEYFN